MRAELLKIRAMPTPLWTGAALVLFFVGGIAACVIWGVGDDGVAIDIAIGLPTMIGSLVLGSWLAGVEFGQNTMRRVVSANPNRAQLVLAKLATLLAVVAAVTVVLCALGAAIYSLAGSGHEASIDFELALRLTAATLVTNIVYAVVALSLTLLTRSMAGGMTMTFVFFFVLDGLTSLIPKVGDYTIGVVQTDVDLAIRQQTDGPFGQSSTHDPGLAAIVLIAWLLVFFAAGMIRTTQSDIK